MGLAIALNETNWTLNAQYSILSYVILNFLGMHVYNWKGDLGMVTTDLRGRRKEKVMECMCRGSRRGLVGDKQQEE